VQCWATSEHTELAVTGGFVTLFPITYLALVGRAVKIFPARIQAVDTQFLRFYRFLFFRFGTESYWYVLVFLMRNMLIALVPILPSVVAQIFFLNLVVLFCLVIVCRAMPWRVYVGNYIDIGSTAGVVLIVSLACIYVEVATESVSTILCVLFVCAAVMIVVAMGYGLFKKFGPQKKQFQFFICHHKAGAGALARLLKMMLVEERPNLKSNVFIDSDNLSNLDVLFDIVANDVEKLVVLCSKEILLRPWCLGEITTVHRKKIKVLPVYLPDFTKPDRDFFTNFSKFVPDISCLTENSIALEDVVGALEWLMEQSNMDGPKEYSIPGLKGFTKEILAWPGSMTSSGSEKKGNDVKSEIYLCGDQVDCEAVATQRILCMLINQHAGSTVIEKPSLAPKLMMDLPQEDGQTQLPDEARVCALCMTGSCLNEPTVLEELYQAMKKGCTLIPVNCDEAFRFPRDTFYRDLHLVASKIFTNRKAKMTDKQVRDEAGWLVDGIEDMFKNIAVLFTPLASASVLSTQSREVYNRIYVSSAKKTDKSVDERSARTIRLSFEAKQTAEGEDNPVEQEPESLSI
jgi:hypothetical protein